MLTGNIAPNAVVKLSAFGLQHWLDLETGPTAATARTGPGPDSSRAPGCAPGPRLGPGDAWVIGDTPRDYECAQAGGAHCLLVATGGYGEDRLRSLGADAVLPDLADTGAVVALLTEGL